MLGDVHAEDETLLAALDFFAAVGVDRVVCVGDVIDGAGNAERCIATLRSREIATVRGNHERWFTESKGMLLSDATPADLAQLRRRHLGFVFQKANLTSFLTARENVEIAGEGGWPQVWAEGRMRPSSIS